MDTQVHNLPDVSIIVPVYNDQDNVGPLIELLLKQNYPSDLLEVIIVDNNSKDATKDIIKEYPVTLLEEREAQSSYAARNKGIEHAKGKILVFTDSDCKPIPTWISNGVKTLLSKSADLVGGNVEFFLSERRTAAEMYDSINHIQVEAGIREQQACPTANLFVRSSLFEEIGLFPAVTSGGDFIWTKKATQNGHKLVFARDAIVKHPTRNLKSLLKKRYRTGGGTLKYWKNANVPAWKIFLLIGRMFLPRRYSMIKKAINERGASEMHKQILRIWLVSYCCSLTTLYAIITSVIRTSSKEDS